MNCAGRISLYEFEHSPLVPTLEQLSQEDDINQVVEFFSYEHFYVIYCKFWELDRDRAFLLSRDDLLRYGNHCLTEVGVNCTCSSCIAETFTSASPAAAVVGTPERQRDRPNALLPVVWLRASTGSSGPSPRGCAARAEPRAA